MKSRWMGLYVGGFLAGMLAGCSTFSSRVGEKRAVFEGLAHADQIRLKTGAINIGDSPDLVYIALGNPDERRIHKTATSTEEIWIYYIYRDPSRGGSHFYWQSYPGWYGGRRRAHPLYYRPLWEPMPLLQESEFARIVFIEGKVSSVNQREGN